MIKLLAVNIAFRKHYFYQRWRLMAQQFDDLDITLIGPKYSEYFGSGKKDKIYAEPIPEEPRFRVYHIDMQKYNFNRGGWVSWELHKIVMKIKPDVIYLIGYENANVTLQMGLLRKLFLPKTKIIGFTMKGVDHPLHSLHYRLRIKLTNKIFDAMTCHYPRGREIILNQRRYKKPVYMQTQVGVNKDYFYEDGELRKEIRKKYDIQDDVFVFGTVGRITAMKGIFDVIDALPNRPDFKIMIVGDGPDKGILMDWIKSKNIENKVIFTGRVKHPDQTNAIYNAMDCFVHIPKTTKSWVDTFPFVIPEAMAVGLPVIASDSGAMSYQLGVNGIISPENNPQELKKAFDYVLDHREYVKTIGKELKERVMKTFEVHYLNKSFNIVLREILSGTFNKKYIDQAKFHHFYE